MIVGFNVFIEQQVTVRRIYRMTPRMNGVRLASFGARGVPPIVVENGIRRIVFVDTRFDFVEDLIRRS